MRLLKPCLSMAVALAMLTAWAQQGGPALPTRPLTAGVHLIMAEVAADDRARQIGLMNRPQLAPNHGMLFVFDTLEKPCMWMRNTLIPLSVAFIDLDGSVVNIEDMEPGSEQIHCAKRPVPYALEMTRGWFSQRGLQPTQTVIGGLPAAPVSPKK
jgi:uncharacterized membrane protein (UPF0127 family)